MNELKYACTCNSWPNSFCDKCQKHKGTEVDTTTNKTEIFKEFDAFNSDVVDAFVIKINGAIAYRNIKIKNLLSENLLLRKQLLQYHKYIEREITYDELQTYMRTIKE
jgi:adenine-specific DNA methylase